MMRIVCRSGRRIGISAPWLVALAVLAVSAAMAGRSAASVAGDDLSLTTAIASRLARTRGATLRAVDHGARRALGAIYAAQGDRPLWSANGRATPQALALLSVLRNAGEYGLNPLDYRADVLTAMAQHAAAQPPGTVQGSQQWAQFDVTLSAETLRLLCDLHFGRIDARAAGFHLTHPRRALDLRALVGSLARGPDVKGVLASVEPTFYGYRLLEQALARYRGLAARDAALTRLPPLPSRSVRPGGVYRGAPALRRRLAAVGDLPAAVVAPPDTASGVELDPQLVSALERFQRRHGLEPDGVLGRATFRQLTTPFAKRVGQIELNLERWRWLPALHAPLVMVNIAQFQLFALRSLSAQAADNVQMRVIVGRSKPSAHTPTFTTDMIDVIFRPYWNVPPRIAVRELLPDIRAEPRFFSAQHLQIVRGQGDSASPVPPTAGNLAAVAAGRLRLRQLPGPDNALGLIKFGVPNPFDVLLHGTPAARLFSHSRRAFSHGCIRVSDPIALARFALRDTAGEWTLEKITAATRGPDNQRVELARPIPVIVVYLTAGVAADGTVEFFDDLYGEDRRLAARLGMSGVRDREPPVTEAPSRTAKNGPPRLDFARPQC